MGFFPREFDDMDFTQPTIRITREQVVAALLICFALAMAILAGWDMGRPRILIEKNHLGQWERVR